MRGRESEWHIVIQRLTAVEDGQGATLLIEGEPGTGKSLLIAETAARASRRGFVPVTGGAEQLGGFIPAAPLLMALAEPPFRDVLDAATPAGPGEEHDPRLRVLRRLRTRLERCSVTRPVLVGLDDLQWAGPGTLAALRALHRELGSAPVLWLLARCTGTGGPPAPDAWRAPPDEARHLFELLEQDGATRLELGPLSEEAVAAVTGDMLGAVPQPDMLALTAGAGGNPFLLTQLLTGLREEGAVEVSGGRARPRSAEPPQRVHALVRRRLDGLGRETRRLVEAAAVLGRSFSAEDAAELVGTAPAALLPAFEEALDAGILTATDQELEFRHELVWRTIVAGLPPPVRHALHHQIGRILLERGGSAMRAAGHLIEGTRPGDARTLRGLDRAVTEVLASSPRAAAGLAVQAVELSDLADPGRIARVVTAIEATTEAGRLGEAESLVRSALIRPVPGPVAAELRCALSRVLIMGGRPAEAIAEARAALSEPGLPRHLRDRATLALLYGLAGLPDTRRAAGEAEAVLMAAERHGEAVVAGAMVVLAVIRWESGRLAEGLRLARAAVQRAQGGPVAVRRTHPRLALASMLTDIRRLDEARPLVKEATEEVEALGHGAWAPVAAALGARVELIAGRLEEAASAAQAGLDLARGHGTPLSGSVAALVLGTVALRRGDLRTAANHMEAERERLSSQAGTAAHARCAVVAAQITEARDGPVDALKLIAHLYTEPREQLRVLVSDPCTAPWLVRVALAAGERASAEAAVRAAESLAAGNPGFRAVGAAASHARGLLEGEVPALRPAARDGADPWARASAAEDLGVALVAEDAHEAVRSLDRALAGYEESGSIRDAARVRRRLRRMGVRHRHWATADRPVSGWASLTDTECTVSLLVTQGWTNRQVADQMFISVHTVAFHLRQIFRKLGIGSRVELTRLAVEQGRDLGHPGGQDRR